MALFVYRVQKFDMPPHNPNHRTYFPNTCCILQPNEAMCKILGMHSLILCIYGNSFSLLYNQMTFLLMTYTCINVVVMSLPTNICYSDIFLRRVQFSFYYFQMCYLIKNKSKKKIKKIIEMTKIRESWKTKKVVEVGESDEINFV